MTESPDRSGGFPDFFRREYKATVTAVMRAGAGGEEAEDAVSEAMALAALRFHLLTAPAAWVRKVAIRRYIRRCQRDRSRAEREPLAVPATAPSRTEALNEVWLVRSLLHGLPPTQRSVLALHLDGYSGAEIAAILGSPQDTVRSNLRHARLAMAAALKKAGWPFN